MGEQPSNEKTSPYRAASLAELDAAIEVTNWLEKNSVPNAYKPKPEVNPAEYQKKIQAYEDVLHRFMPEVYGPQIGLLSGQQTTDSHFPLQDGKISTSEGNALTQLRRNLFYERGVRNLRGVQPSTTLETDQPKTRGLHQPSTPTVSSPPLKTSETGRLEPQTKQSYALDWLESNTARQFKDPNGKSVSTFAVEDVTHDGKRVHIGRVYRGGTGPGKIGIEESEEYDLNDPERRAIFEAKIQTAYQEEQGWRAKQAPAVTDAATSTPATQVWRNGEICSVSGIKPADSFKNAAQGHSSGLTEPDYKKEAQHRDEMIEKIANNLNHLKR